MSSERLALIDAERNVKRAGENLERAIRDMYPAGSNQVYTQGRHFIKCQVMKHSADRVRVINHKSGAKHWIDYSRLVVQS